MKRVLLVLSLLVLLPLQGAKASRPATIPPHPLALGDRRPPDGDHDPHQNRLSPHFRLNRLQRPHQSIGPRGWFWWERTWNPLKEMGNPKKSSIPLFVLADHCAPLIGPADHPNPHLWLSPRRMAKATPALGEFLARLDPANAPLYRKRAGEVKRRLEELDRSLTQQSRSLSKRAVVVHHPSWNYLLEDYGIRVVATVERNDEETPSPRRIQEILETMKRERVDVISRNPTFRPLGKDALPGRAGPRSSCFGLHPNLKSYAQFLEKISSSQGRTNEQPSVSTGLRSVHLDGPGQSTLEVKRSSSPSSVPTAPARPPSEVILGLRGQTGGG